MRFSAIALSIAIAATPASATFCLLGLPDPFFPCPDKTTAAPAPVMPTAPAVPDAPAPEAPAPETEKPNPVPESQPTGYAHQTTPDSTTVMAITILVSASGAKPSTLSTHAVSYNSTASITKPSLASPTVAQFTPGPNGAGMVGASLGLMLGVVAGVAGFLG